MKGKIGRPTDSPKQTVIRARVDDETLQKLDSCTEQLEKTRSEVIRQGIDKVYYDTFERKHLPPEDSCKLAWVKNALMVAKMDGIITDREKETIISELTSVQSMEEFSTGTWELIERVIHDFTDGKRDNSTLLVELEGNSKEGENE